MRTIEAGDLVVFSFATKVFVADLHTYQISGTVIHVPQDTGDHFHAKTKSGIQFTVNPNCSVLVGITIIDTKE